MDSRLDFKDHLEILFKKVSRTIGHLRKIQNLLPRKTIVVKKIVYKSTPGI